MESEKLKSVPMYMKRRGFRPRKPEDFGDGGAFPEIHVSQYPLGMFIDRFNKPDSEILPVTVDSHGNVVSDAIVRQGENLGKIVYSQHSDVIPNVLKINGDAYDDDVDEEELKKETTEMTKAAIEKIVKAGQGTDVVKQVGDSKYVKYKPSQRFSSGAKERIVKVSEMPVDPLELPKFRHKRVPVASGSGDPVPVMHSPPRGVSVKELQDSKIAPCVSNWKNGKGYTIPFDKRCAADGRALQEVHVNDKFAMLSETFDIGERKAREAVSMRLKVKKEMEMKEKKRKEKELRALALKARSERTVAASEDVNVSRGKYEYESETGMEKEERMQRDQIREERRRDRRMPEGKKSKIARDRDRDVGEKVALGMAFTGGRGGEVMYDQRLFNQEKGTGSGFATDDQYNVYDKGLFTAQPTLSTLYRPKKDMDDEMYVNKNEQRDKLTNTERFKPDKAFSGPVSEKAGKRLRPVEFEEEEEGEEQDLFGLKRWESDLKKGKMLSDKAGPKGTMRGRRFSSTDEYGGGSG
ncbi:unnamed protein product [Cochlearia groenlandica]